MLSVEGFEGPLDWLLEMVRTHKIDLERLSILDLVEAFAAAMESALIPDLPALELARWAAWTVMATQLAELRSRLMLPAKDPDTRAAQREAEALRQQWISHAQMIATANWLDRQPQLGRDVFARGRAEAGLTAHGAARRRASSDDDTATDDADGLEAAGRDDLTALLRACLVALRLPLHPSSYQPRRLPFWTVGDATARINSLLPTQNKPALLEAFLPENLGVEVDAALHRRATFAATLIAGLELARCGSLTLDQEGSWQPIRVAS